MRIGIIGSGNIGGTATRLFAEAGHEVAVSHSGPPETLAPLVEAAGPNARAVTVEEAAEFGDVVLLAIPWRARMALPAEQLKGKIVIDAMNPYAPDHSVYDLGASTSSEEVQKTLPGARVVKAFNTLFARDLASLGRPELPAEQRTVLFFAGDDQDANRLVANLIWELGFAPFPTGSLREGGSRQQPGSPVYTRRLTLAEAARALGISERAATGVTEQVAHPE